MAETSIEAMKGATRRACHERADVRSHAVPSRSSGQSSGAGCDPIPPLRWDEAQLRHAIEAAGVALWSWNVDDDAFAMDERAFALWGLTRSEVVTFEDLSTHIHPSSRPRPCPGGLRRHPRDQGCIRD